MAVDIKGVLLEMAEENAKVLIKELIGPLLLQELEAKLPGASAIAGPIIAELVAEGVKLADKINPADNA